MDHKKSIIKFIMLIVRKRESRDRGKNELVFVDAFRMFIVKIDVNINIIVVDQYLLSKSCFRQNHLLHLFCPGDGPLIDELLR